jgi:hypothetical protein
VHITPLMHRGASIGRWAIAAWNPRHRLAAHGHRFVEELAGSIRRNFATATSRRELIRIKVAHHTSRFATFSALPTMKSRRGSTTSPISVLNT